VGVSRAWFRAFRILYRILGWLDPPLRAAHRAYGIGNVVELRVPGRNSGRSTTTLLGLLRTGGQIYLGHPNGDCSWTRNLEAAGSGELLLRGLPPVEVRAVRLEPGPEREAVIRSTGQHPFPGNAVYRLGRRHVLAVGTYFRLEPLLSPA
jgi:hypothetical protein